MKTLSMLLAVVGVVVGAIFLSTPSLKWSACGIGGADASVARAEPDQATVRTVVFDVKEKKQWVDFWSISSVAPKGKIHLGAGTGKTKTLLGIRIPVEKRDFKVELPFDHDISGTANGFTYEVQWLKKRG